MADDDYTCTDTDGGINYYNRGFASNKAGGYGDNCDSGGNKLYEWYCDNTEAIKDALNEKQIKTYLIDDEQYIIKIEDITFNEPYDIAIFSVNGIISNALKVGDRCS